MSAPSGQHLLVRSITPVSGQPIELGTINVFVGANRAGKSESLRDIARLAGKFEPSGTDRSTDTEPQTRIIQDLTFVPKLTMERLLRGLVSLEGTKEEGAVVQGVGPDLKTPYRRSVAAELKNILFRPVITARSVRMTPLGEIMPLRVAYVPTESRTKLLDATGAASPLRAPENLLQTLQFAGPGIQEQIDAAVSAVFDSLQVRLDATEQISLTLRAANSFPQLSGRPLDDAQQYQRLPSLADQGEGVKSCVAVILTFLLCQGRIVLLDEPEGFLQPDRARRLGVWISDNAARLNTQVFIASRNEFLLEGLFSGAADVSVLRISRRDEIPRIELVPPEIGKSLVNFPLFAAQRAVRCLLCDGAIVTPQESDRIIYQTVARRFHRADNVCFLHAHGERNLPFVAKVLRRANLSTCVIAETDLFQSEPGYVELVKSLSGQPPPQPWMATRERLVSHVEGWFDESELSSTASEVEQFLEQMKKGEPASPEPSGPTPKAKDARDKWDRLRREKLAVLPTELRVWVEELLEDMKRIGLLMSPKGQLQGWMNFGAEASDKEIWFNRAIQTLDRGECPADLRAFVAEALAFVQPSGKRF